MHQAIPYRTWQPLPSTRQIDPRPIIEDDENNNPINRSDKIRNLISENPVLVLGRRGCCMCHVVNRLLQGLGVNPVVYEVEEDEELGMVKDLATNGDDQRLQFPAVFIGGTLVGGLDRLMAVHISGDLVPILKKAGALWL